MKYMVCTDIYKPSSTNITLYRPKA